MIAPRNKPGYAFKEKSLLPLFTNQKVSFLRVFVSKSYVRVVAFLLSDSPSLPSLGRLALSLLFGGPLPPPTCLKSLSSPPLLLRMGAADPGEVVGGRQVLQPVLHGAARAAAQNPSLHRKIAQRVQEGHL